MHSVDQYFGRRYKASTYNCAHFVCDVWRDIKGEEFSEALAAMLCARHQRRAVLSDLKRIRFLDKPESPCVVLLQAKRRPTHVGVWIRGAVLHIQERQDVQFQSLDVVRIGFERVRFLTC
jgi:hypothetical protein